MTLTKLIDAHVVFVFFGHLWSANGLGTDEPVGGGESPIPNEPLAPHGFQSSNKSHDGQAADIIYHFQNAS